jgi:hypothetical protein
MPAAVLHTSNTLWPSSSEAYIKDPPAARRFVYILSVFPDVMRKK